MTGTVLGGGNVEADGFIRAGAGNPAWQIIGTDSPPLPLYQADASRVRPWAVPTPWVIIAAPEPFRVPM